MTSNKLSLSRRVGAAVLFATMIATGGAVSAGITSSAQAADGPPRCCH